MQLTKLSDKSVDYIISLERKSDKFGLENIKKFLKLIGNPQDSLKIIHVAGTNGKGSVCAMLLAVLQEAGYKVGMFTSPHLIKINERIKINDKSISDKELDELTEKVINLQKEYNVELTFFETLTVIAFLYFKENNLDYILLEAGLGGRLDATNVANPLLSIITNIGLEHRELLGDTIEEIAKEKAGIIKQGVKVITNAKAKAFEIIKEKAGDNLILAEKTDFKTNLKGDFQIENAGTAVTVLRQLGIDEEHIRKGLEKVEWPGRFEFIRENIILDSAHNPDGIKALVKSIKKLKYDNLTVIFGVMRDKDVKGMAAELNKLDAKIIITKANVSRAISLEKASKYFKDAIITENLGQAIKKANGLVLITGSIYLIGEAYGLLNN